MRRTSWQLMQSCHCSWGWQDVHRHQSLFPSLSSGEKSSSAHEVSTAAASSTIKFYWRSEARHFFLRILRFLCVVQHIVFKTKIVIRSGGKSLRCHWSWCPGSNPTNKKIGKVEWKWKQHFQNDWMIRDQVIVACWWSPKKPVLRALWTHDVPFYGQWNSDVEGRFGGVLRPDDVSGASPYCIFQMRLSR